MTDSATLDDQVELLRVLAHPVRLSLLTALIGGERGVSELEAATNIGQPLLSQQLAVLRRSRLVDTRRQAKQVFYCLNAARIGDVTAILATFPGGTSDLPSGPDRTPTAHTTSAAQFARIG